VDLLIFEFMTGIMIIAMFEGDVITNVREDFKTNSSFTNP